MSRKKSGLVLLLALFTGLFGGVVSDLLFSVRIVSAEEEEKAASEIPEVITAREFRLVDKEGKLKAALHLSKDGLPALLLYDKDRVTVRLEIAEDGSTQLVFLDGKGVSRTKIALSPEGLPCLGLYNQEGNLSAELALSGDNGGLPALRLRDKDGEPKAILHLSKDGLPALLLYDKSKATVRLEAAEDGSTHLVFLDKDGNTRTKIALSPEGLPILGLYNQKGKLSAELALSGDSGDSPALILYDKKGEERAVLSLDEDETPTLILHDKYDRIISPVQK